MVTGPAPVFHTERAPYVIYLNHPSWWDPLVALLLARHYAAPLSSYAPIDTAMLAKFPFFRKLGFFGVDKGQWRGVQQFRQQSRTILLQRGTALWLTPQGAFVDQRHRPVELRRGIATLPELGVPLRFVPLALDYHFADERLPVVAARFGAPIWTGDYPFHSRNEWAGSLAAGLEVTQDELAQDVLSGRVHRGEVLISRSAGTGGIYGLWQSIRGRAC